MEDKLIEVLKRKIRNVQKMTVDVSDLSLTYEPKKSMEMKYANSLEGELLQELDETRDIYRRGDLIEKVKQVRKMNREAAKQKVIAEMEELKDTIKFNIGIKENDIGIIKAENEKLREQQNAYTRESDKKQEVMRVKKGKSTLIVYKVAEEDSIKLLQAKREVLKRIEANNREIQNISQDVDRDRAMYAEFDNLIVNFDSEIIQDIDEQTLEPEENPEADLPPAELEENPETELPLQPTEPEENLETDLPLQPTEPEENPETDLPSQPTYEIKGVVCSIVDGELTYTVRMLAEENGKKQMIEEHYPIKDSIIMGKSEKSEFAQVYKSFERDIGYNLDADLFYSLYDVMEQYGVYNFKESSDFRYLRYFGVNSDQGLDFNITYDLRNIGQSNLSFSEKRQLKGLAKRGEQNGIAKYIKKPNLLERIFSKKIAEPIQDTENEREVPEDVVELSAEEKMEKVMEDYRALSEEEGFSMESFQKQYDLTEEEMDNLIQGEKARKLEEKREKMGIGVASDIKEEIAKKVKEFNEKRKTREEPTEKEESIQEHDEK